MSESIVWQRSTFCDTAACLEIAIQDDEVLVRNSTSPDHVLAVTRATWLAFVAGIKDAGDE
ncbi:DUF397 domain-containing protein [Actinoplanes sp. CA-015351]|uniref:DUF397 domain-containing protein n=1 Tax=Actinoplanes sp. CA-015351 TaxID=3239897 RepID=UPI003D97BF94